MTLRLLKIRWPSTIATTSKKLTPNLSPNLGEGGRILAAALARAAWSLARQMLSLNRMSSMRENAFRISRLS
jgi:hypothetical protein